MLKKSSSTRNLLPAIVLLLLILISIQPSSAKNSLPGGFQPGFVINPSGDTLQGYIRQREGRSAYFQCSFIAQPGDPVQTFGPGDIKGYGVGPDMIYHTITIDLATFLNHFEYDVMQIQASDEVMRILHIVQENAEDPDFEKAELLKREESDPPLTQPVFLRLLLEGYMSLYIYEQLPFVIKEGDKAYLLKQYYQTMRQEGRTVSRRRDEYQGILSFLTTDCPDANAMVAKTRYNMPAIAKVVKEYNNCIGQGTWDTGGISPSVRIRPGVSLMAGSSTLSLESNPEVYTASETNSQSVNAIAPGIGIMIDFPYLKHNIRASASVHYFSANFDNIVYPFSAGAAMLREERFTIRHDYLKLPFLIHYSPFRSQWNPSLIVGAVVNFNLKDEYTREAHLTDLNSGEVQISPRGEYHVPVPVNAGLLAGIEVYRPMANRGFLSLGLRYEHAGSPFRFLYHSQYSMPFTRYANLGYLSLQVGYFIGSR
jgi:hypothetical protein